ncbi:hypothetical protein BJX99DRAFT_225040 [Aspergillus californicus]
MNNEQFRRLLFENSQKTNPKSKPNTKASPENDSNSRTNVTATPGGPGGALGSRMRSSIPMTPRNLTAPDFNRQLADYRRESQPGHPPPNKKFRSSAAPKGTKLPTGYQDRAARLREVEAASESSGAKAEAEGEDGNKDTDKGGTAEKLKVVEERFKKGLIDEETFQRLRRELGVGGDLGSTHMIKGLDWDLLRKIRAGEDVNAPTVPTEEAKDEDGVEGEGGNDGVDEVVDVDEEFDKMMEGKTEEEALPSAPKEQEKKKGSMAPPPVPVQKRSRNEILRELRESRAAAVAAAAANATPEPALSARFKRIGDPKVEKKRFIEQDENGRRREVLLITDADGITKRKTRWLDKPGTVAPSTSLPAPDKEAKPLGMEVPAEIAAKAAASQAVEEDDDIFEGVGDDYNPLGAGSDDDSSASESEEGEVATNTPQKTAVEEPSKEPVKSRNYFATATTEEVENDRANPLTRDPVLLAALKRAAALRQASPGQNDEDAGVDKDTLLHRKKFLEEARRREELDAMDIDYGFGGSRNDDDEDDENVILEREGGGGTKRKRGPRKRKGDKDSASDVLGVLERRKKA